MIDLLIENARIVSPTHITRGSIAIADGTIESVGDTIADTPARRTIDASGMVALPGAVDLHTHMHDPAVFPPGIDFQSETAAAIAGGVTTVVELPTQTPITTPAAVHRKIRRCSARAHVDFGLVAGNVQDSAVDVAGLQSIGVPELKAFTADPYRASEETLLELFTNVAENGTTVRVHCEYQPILDHARDSVSGSDPVVYPDSRPVEAELAAIERVGRLASYTDCPVHIVHISSAKGVALGNRIAERNDAPVTLETCPQYLAFTRDALAAKGPYCKVNPPLRTSDERDRLWEFVQDGSIDCIATDHFPSYRADRQSGWDDIWEPPAGLPGVETLLEWLISEGVHDGRISWERACELVCANPARRAGLYPRKGSLRVGTDADLVLIDRTTHTVAPEQYAFVGDWTPFSGREWTARVATVIAGGEIVATDHTVHSDPGRGQFLPR